MKKFSAVLVLILALLLSGTAMATENNWIVANYAVDRDQIYPGDRVDIDVWLYNAATPKNDIKVAAETSSFNDVEEIIPIYDDELEEEYRRYRFVDALYVGEGNNFMMRVNGEPLNLTIYECVPKSEAQQNPDQTAPVLQVGRSDQPGPIAKGQTQTVTLWIHNLTDYDLTDVTAVVTPSSDLQIADNSVTYPAGRIWSRDVVFFDVNVRSFGEITSASQSLTVEVGYTYEKDGVMTQGTSSHTVPLSAVVSKETETATASVPNVIISAYDFGADKVMAGTAFDLALEFKNTSSVRQVENIVMTIDPGTALAITSSANSFHFPSLGAGAVQQHTINLQALPDAPSAPAAIKVGFAYEYLDGDQRKTATVEQTVSLPVYQLDRFELTQNMTYVEAWQYEECWLTLSYINKGKGTVYNVSCELQGDMNAMEKVQHVGNVEAGRSGTIDFIINPETAGDNSCKLVVTYEDEAMQVMTKEFDFDVFVNEAYVPEVLPEMEVMPEEPAKTGSGWIFLVIGIAAAAAVTVVIVVRKKKKKAGVVDEFQFDDCEEDVHAPS